MTTSSKHLGTSTRSRATAGLNKTLEKNLIVYVAAAAATGVGALALVQPAEAKIVYTPTNVNITPGLGLDLNNDGITDFIFKATYTYSTDVGGVSWASILPAQSGNRIWGKKVSGNFGYNDVASALRPGVTIRANKKLQSRYRVMCDNSAHTDFGSWWFMKKPRYLGLKFYVDGQAHYGWARAEFSEGCTSGVLTGYAYETVPNKSIKTGKTHGPDVITVQPATLGHLARGASGLLAWRRTN